MFRNILASALCTHSVAGLLRSVPQAQGGMTVTNLRLASVNGSPATLRFGEDFELGVDSNGDFAMGSRASPALTISNKNVMTIQTPSFVVKSLDLQGDFSVMGVPQWRLVHVEDLSGKSATGWDNNLVSECAGIVMLGGHCQFSQGEVTKKLEKLPPHSQIRVKANYHFIDAWVGETGFLRLNVGKDGGMVHVWTDRHSQNREERGVNVCGNEISEGKFSSAVDVALPHNAESLVIGFGSTLDEGDPCDVSFGVSGIEVYVR